MNIETPDKEYSYEPHLVHSCQYHVIFCPKYRRPVLVDGVDKRLKEMIREKQKEYGYKIIEMEVMPDNVHLLLSVHPKIGVYNAVCHMKGYTSHALRKEFPKLKSRLPTLWTRSKFISSVGAVSLETVKKYIEDQKSR